MRLRIIILLFLPLLLTAQIGKTSGLFNSGTNLRVPANGIELQVKDFPHEGDAIIFLHFGGGNLMMWQRALPYFADRYHIILVDMRGHGKSDKPQIGNHIDEMAKDIAAMMDHLKIDNAHIIGSSLGAEVGLALAANYPGKAKSLICDGALYSEFGPYGIWNGSEEDFKNSLLVKINGAVNYYTQLFNSAEEMIEQNKKVFAKNGWWNQYFKEFIEYNLLKNQDGKFSGSWQVYSVKEYLTYYFDYKFEDYYKKVHCPVLMLPGEEHLNDARIKNAMYGLSKLIKNCTIIENPEWIHPYGWLVNPDEICKNILNYLEGL